MADRELTLGTIFTGRVDATFRGAVADLRKMLDRLARVSGKAGMSMGAAGAGARGATNEFTQMNKQLSHVHGGFQRLTAAAKVTMAYSLAATAIWGTVNALRGAVSVIFEYDQALKNLQAITQSTDAQTQALSYSIKEVASRTKYSTQEVAEAAIVLGQAGFTASETIDAINAVAMLATGTLSDMGKTADLLTTAIRAFGEEASESGRIADIFASAVNKSKLTIDKLRTAFNYLGPISRQAGLSLEETASGAMLLANAGLRASTIGTGFRQVLARLVNPSRKLRVIFKATGADLEKLNPATASLREIMGELNKILGESVPKAIRAQRAFQLFGLRGASVAAAFAQAGVEGFDEMYDYVMRMGTASEMAEKQMEGLAVMTKNLMDKIQLLAVALGDGGIAGAFRVLLNVLRPFVDVLIYMASTIAGKLVVAFVSLTTVISLSRLAMKYILIQLTALAAGLTMVGVKANMAAAGVGFFKISLYGLEIILKRLWTVILAHPMGVLAAGFALVAVSMVTWIQHLSGAKKALEENIIRQDTQVKSLERYQERLKKTTVGEKEHTSILRRLIDEYPILAEKVDLAVTKFIDEGDAVKELVKQKKMLIMQDRGKLLDEEIKALDRLNARLEKYKKQYEDRRLSESAWAEAKRILMPKINRAEFEYNLRIREVTKGLELYGITAKSTLTDISVVLAHEMNTSVKNAERHAKAIKNYYDVLAKKQKETAEQAATKKKEQLSQIEALGEAWLRLYKSLEKDPARQAELLLTLDKLHKKIEKMEEAAMNLGLTSAQTEALVTLMYKKAYDSFVKKQGDQQKLMRKMIDDMELKLIGLSKTDQEAEERKVLNAKKTRDEKIELWDDEGKKAKALALSQQTYLKELTEIEKKYFNMRIEFYSKLDRTVAVSLDQREKKELSSSASFYRKSRIWAKKHIMDGEELHWALARMEKGEKEDRLTIIQKFYELKEKERERDEKKEAAAARKALSDIEKARKADKRRVKALYKNLDDFLKMGVLTAEEYSDILEEAYLHDLLTYEEMIQKKIIADGTWLGQLKFGLSDSLIKMKTWGDTIVEIGKGLGDTIATNLTGGLLDFMEGTKKAEVAFEDFARNTLRWLGDLIIKQIMLNAVQGIIRRYSVAPAYNPAMAGGEGFVPGVTDRAYAGGGWINEPVIGRGMRTGQTYSIAEKRPEYVGSGRGQNVKVELINKSGTELKVSESEARFDGRELIVTTIIDAYDRNAYGMRDMFGGRR